MSTEIKTIEYLNTIWSITLHYSSFLAESFATKSLVIKGMRRHAKARVGEVRYKYCHYFVRLEEGKPPKDYYVRDSTDGDVMLRDWMDQMHRRKIHGSL